MFYCLDLKHSISKHEVLALPIMGPYRTVMRRVGTISHSSFLFPYSCSLLYDKFCPKPCCSYDLFRPPFRLVFWVYAALKPQTGFLGVPPCISSFDETQIPKPYMRGLANPWVEHPPPQFLSFGEEGLGFRTTSPSFFPFSTYPEQALAISVPFCDLPGSREGEEDQEVQKRRHVHKYSPCRRETSILHGSTFAAPQKAATCWGSVLCFLI